MEKKDWEERLTSSFSYSMGEGEYFMIDGEETNIDDLKEFIQKELDKAREEGYEKGKDYQARLDRELYGMSFEQIKSGDFNLKTKEDEK